MPLKRRNESDSDPKDVTPAQPKTRRGQKKAQLDGNHVNIPSQHPPVETDLQKPEKPRPRPKPRGRPRGTVTPAGTPQEETSQTPTDINIDQEAANEPPPKRSKNNVNVDITEPIKGKSARGQRPTKVVPPREPLPDRTGRNVHPVKPKATRRTAQEVAADREAQIRELQDRIRVAEEAKELLAQMHVNEEHDDEQMLVDNPQRLSAAIRKRGRDLEDSEGEDFDFDSVEKGSYSDDEVVEPVKRKTTKRSKKQAKGELRNDIESREAKLRKMEGTVQDEGGKLINETVDSDTIFTPFDTAPKKYQNSGLRKNQQANRAPETLDPFLSGGLNDEDTISVPPSFPTSRARPLTQTHAPPVVKYPEVLQRDHSRRNNHVEVIDSDSDEIIRKNTPPKKTRLRGPKKQTSNAAASLTAAEFLRDRRWANVFIPTITHTLYVSREPFRDFTPESPVFLAKVQEVFDLSFTNVDFKLEFNDPLVTTAYDRLKTRKSKIASEVLQAITTFFEKGDFSNNPKKIRAYVRWALRGDGPAYYKFPAPQSCKLDREHPDYEAPDGFLQSDFMASIAARNLGYIQGSILHSSLDARRPPKGLYALLMTAVERGFTAFAKGTYSKPKQFAHENVWHPLQIFLGHVDSISERRWRLILESRNDDLDIDSEADESMISACRGELYIPLSPQKV